MSLNDLLRGNPKAMTKDYEGFRDTIYMDSEGKRTVGYGFNLDDPLIAKMLPREVATGGRPITQKEADELFEVFYSNAMDDAVAYAGGEKSFSSLPIEAQNVIVDMAYNLGKTKLDGFVDTKKAMLKRDWKNMAAEMKDSNWYKQVGRRSKDHIATIRSLK